MEIDHEHTYKSFMDSISHFEIDGHGDDTELDSIRAMNSIFGFTYVCMTEWQNN
jgi:hypothetical protein